ncbi:MAG TPA: cytochrome C [Burkholderiales bacterium]|nr:cytochrome C [Burkholderiales bacterium]
MSRKMINALLLAAFALPFSAAAAQSEESQVKANSKADPKQIQRGRYLAKIAGCNDCHTAGYAMSGGKVPEAQWLVGDKLGWRGPWGTTYAINLRLYMKDMTEAQWVRKAKTVETRPPMPWFALHDMSEQDLKAIYHFTKSLGPAGEPAPQFVPPGKEPQGPYVQFPAPRSN